MLHNPLPGLLQGTAKTPLIHCVSSPMEAFGLFQLWKTTTKSHNTAIETTTTTTKEPAVPEWDQGCDADDDADSYFELELELSNYDAKPAKIPPRNDNVLCRNDTDSDISCSKRSSTTSSSSDDGCFYTAINSSVESPDIRPNSEDQPLQSPISILRSQTLRSLMFGNQYSKSSSKGVRSKAEITSFTPSPMQLQRKRGNFFAVRFRNDNVSKFRRSNSSSSRMSTTSGSGFYLWSSDDSSSSKRFSIIDGGVRKYMNLFRPLYFKLSRRNDRDGGKIGEENNSVPAMSIRSPPARKSWMWSPMNAAAAREKVDRRRSSSFGAFGRSLGKNRSASSVVGVAHSPVNISQQEDGIEGAILHCKRSLNSCPDAASNGSSETPCE
ncbi:hypothetical protein Dimus_035594 [Dionaea muscipula]